MEHTEATFPVSPAELTAEWLTTALGEAGQLSDSRVVAFDHEIIGEGVGFVGQLARIRLQYDRAEAGAPASVVGKFPSPNEGARQTAAIFGVYAREVGFYQTMADKLAIATPRCYFAAITADASAFMLLLEDLTQGRFGDQVAGCTVDEARIILGEAAKLHAQWWNNPALDEHPWLQKGTDIVRGSIVAAYAFTWPIFVERFRDHLTPRALQHGPTLGDKMLGMLDKYEAAPTYTFGHSDYRFDNIFFPSASDPRPAIVLDWQGSLRIWSGAYDVAYFLGTGMPVPERRAHGDELQRGYHEALVALGVQDYPYEQLAEDCRIGLLMAFAIIGVIAGGTLDMVNERAVAMFVSFFDRLLSAIEDAHAWELLA